MSVSPHPLTDTERDSCLHDPGVDSGRTVPSGPKELQRSSTLSVSKRFPDRRLYVSS